MAILEHNDPVLYELNDKVITQRPRPYLGLSQIGHSCHRYLQHYHYWTFKSTYSSRIQRLFDVGHAAEDIMIDDLAKVGIVVTNRQDSIIGSAGHWKGHTDGRATTGILEPFLVEFKTHNDKSFKSLKKDKVQKSKKGHYDQMQAYMGYQDLSLALYMAINKNDSEYYIEWVEFDEAYFKELKRKEVEIIVSDTMLPRIGNDSKTWFECKFCDAKATCFGEKEVTQNCRNCEHVDVLSEGKWQCNKHSVELSIKDQIEGCNSYELGEMFK
jgi:hypothetical protein